MVINNSCGLLLVETSLIMAQCSLVGCVHVCVLRYVGFKCVLESFPKHYLNKQHLTKNERTNCSKMNSDFWMWTSDLFGFGPQIALNLETIFVCHSRVTSECHSQTKT